MLIRALDRDYSGRGWKAVIEGIADQRVTLKIDPTIDRDILSKNEVITGDVVVTFKPVPDGKEMPIEYYLLSLSVE